MDSLLNIGEVMTAIGAIFTGILGMVTSAFGTIVANPILATVFLLPFAGMGISTLKRLKK